MQTNQAGSYSKLTVSGGLGKDIFMSSPTTPGIGGSLGFLSLPDLPNQGIGSGRKEEVSSPLSDSLAKNSISKPGQNPNASRLGGVNSVIPSNQDEIDEFDFLMQESFERK